MDFVDTSAWFAYFLPNDPDHQRIRSCFRASSRLKQDKLSASPPRHRLPYMDIAIRETTEADLPDIFRIQTDPLVQPHQYKLTRRDTIDLWKQQLFGGRERSRMLFKCTTIVRRSQIIGHISQLHYEAYGQRVCYCGWNLAPAYWGQGIAVIALSQLFDSFFGGQHIGTVISDCFSYNQRCIRVLQKLNYEPAGIRLYERLQILIVRHCLHWIRRFTLTAERWHVRSQ